MADRKAIIFGVLTRYQLPQDNLRASAVTEAVDCRKQILLVSSISSILLPGLVSFTVSLEGGPYRDLEQKLLSLAERIPTEDSTRDNLLLDHARISA